MTAKRTLIKTLPILIVAITLLFATTGCKKNNKGVNTMEPIKELQQGEDIAIITTNYGTITVRFFPDAAPKAVENFITHVNNGYYDGITFHRVIQDFMIQGGDPEGTGMGGESIWKEPFEDEFDVNYRNFRGAISMANSGPNTNGSQFFIVQGAEVPEDIIKEMKRLGEEQGFPKEIIERYEKYGGAYWLDGRHTVFGEVIEGMDVVDKIAAVQVDGNDKPIKPVIMEKVEMTTYTK